MASKSLVRLAKAAAKAHARAAAALGAWIAPFEGGTAEFIDLGSDKVHPQETLIVAQHVPPGLKGVQATLSWHGVEQTPVNLEPWGSHDSYVSGLEGYKITPATENFISLTDYARGLNHGIEDSFNSLFDLQRRLDESHNDPFYLRMIEANLVRLDEIEGVATGFVEAYGDRYPIDLLRIRSELGIDSSDHRRSLIPYCIQRS